MPQPTNGELKLMIENIHNMMEAGFLENSRCHREVNDHLRTLNGQVIKNTKFRYQALAYVPIVALLVNLFLAKLFE
jgi:hypothetical protein